MYVHSNHPSYLLNICRVINTDQLFDVFSSFVALYDVNTLLNEHNQNVLHCLCKENGGQFLWPCLRIVLGKMRDINAKDRDGLTCIRLLCRHNTSFTLLENLKLLIENGASIIGAFEDLCEFNHSEFGNEALVHLSTVCIEPREIKSAFIKLLKNNKTETLIPNLLFILKLAKNHRVHLKNENGLHHICANNQTKTLLTAIKILNMKDFSFNEFNETGCSAFHVLCSNIHHQPVLDSVKFLIQKNQMLIDAKDMCGSSPLHRVMRVATGFRLFSIIKFFHENGANVNLEDDELNTPLHILCQSNVEMNFHSLDFLLKKSKFLDKRNKKGMSPIELLANNIGCCIKSSLICFLKNPLDLTQSNALSIYCKRQHLDPSIVSLLIEHGCNVNGRFHFLMENNQYHVMTPLWRVCTNARDPCEVVRCLIENQANMSEIDHHIGWSLLHAVCFTNHDSELFKLLNFKHLAIDFRDTNGQTCLHVLCTSPISNSFVSLLVTVLRCGVNVNIVDNLGETAIFKLFKNAEMQANLMLMRTCVRWFVSFGTDFNVVNVFHQKATNFLDSQTCSVLLEDCTQRVLESLQYQS